MNPAETYILKQPEKYREILMYLQLIIEKSINDLELKFKWHLPFYYYKTKPFCYLNVTHGYVDLCFMKGTQLTQHQDKLIGENRKLVKSLRYWSLDEINKTVIHEVLEELKVLY
ncbi:DUF1801 domain-containing protein [Galbibacter mesophilus]|uniref:DUF1801 domain-containing protein n=1 Tax=Galbibacter mesophilus TaxID=379069 RepID=UPI0019200215|nr:DUF1801 domain-containing protein [Galbibacter mesophilus]MCM5661421.1 DUF1801 domain-containing protein [Galbibacter mesophilus]